MNCMGDGGMVNSGLIPMMENQDFQVGDVVEVVVTDERSRIKSIQIDPSAKDCAVIKLRRIDGDFAPSDIIRVR